VNTSLIASLSRRIKVNRFALLYGRDAIDCVFFDTEQFGWSLHVKPGAIAMVYARRNGYVYMLASPAGGYVYGHGVGDIENGIAVAREDLRKI
jgi:hypothetical protein